MVWNEVWASEIWDEILRGEIISFVTLKFLNQIVILSLLFSTVT